MDYSEADFQKYLKHTSSRHHFIPQFLINGFANSEKQLFIYDKQNDIILKKPRSPKSVFFQIDRNTLALNDSTKTSILEDFLYSEIDNKASKVIKKYQTQDVSEIDFNMDDTAQILFFLITLFWRIPKTDYAADNLMDHATITTDGINPEILRNDPVYRKLNRAGLFKHHIAQIREFGIKENKWYNLHQTANDSFVIGDYPFLLRKDSGKFSDFNDTDILFAISSRRIYSSTNNSMKNFANINSLMYNACIIEQSVKSITCGNLATLEKSVKYYKKIKETALIYTINDEVFNIG